MHNTIKTTGKSGSILTGMAISSLIAITITLFASALIATLLKSERITWVQAGYWIMVMLFIAAFLSGKCAYTIIRRQKMIIAIMSGLLYWGILLCLTGLFFGGNFDAIPETAGVIMAGSFTQLLLSKPDIKKQRTIRRNSIIKFTKSKCG